MVKFSVKILISILLFAMEGELIAEEMVKSLVIRFQKGSSTEQRLVIKKLKDHKDSFLLPFFIQQLDNKDLLVRALAYEGISGYPESGVLPVFKTGLKDSSLFIEEHVLSLLSRLSSEEAISLALPFMAHKESGIQLTAARVLGHIGHLETVRFLAQYLKSPNEVLRVETLKAILNIVRNNQLLLYTDFDSEYPPDRKKEAFKRVSLVLNATLPFIEEYIQANRASRQEKEYAAALFAIYSEFIPSKLKTYSLFEEDASYRLKAGVINDALRAAAENIMSTFPLQPPLVRSLILDSVWRYQNQFPAVHQMLIDGLSDTFFLVRQTAINGLKALNSADSAEEIIALIHDKNHYVKTAALKALYYFSENIDFTSVLSPLLNDPDPDIKWYAIRILGESHKLSKETILSLFSSPEDRIRAASVRYTSFTGDDRATLDLAYKASHDNSRLVREEAVYALTTLKDSGLKTSVLEGLLLDRASSVKRGAINEIKKGAGHLTKQQNSVMQKIIVKLLTDEDYHIRAAGAEILGSIGREEAIKPLKILLTRDTNPVVIKSATESLKKISFQNKTGWSR